MWRFLFYLQHKKKFAKKVVTLEDPTLPLTAIELYYYTTKHLQEY